MQKTEVWSDGSQDAPVHGPEAHREHSDSGSTTLDSFGLGSGFVTTGRDGLTNYSWNPVL